MKLNDSTLVLHENAAALASGVAQRIAEVAAQAISARGEFRLALAGGETPRRCYQQLCKLPLDWTHVQVFFGDERCLPKGDPQRNDTMAFAALLNHVAIPSDNIHIIPAEQGAILAALSYADTLKQFKPLDLVLLGMGEDGHTASLFPGNQATELPDTVVPVFDAPKPPPQRVSLGMKVLQAVRQRIFMVAGVGKREALIQIFDGVQLPAARVGVSEWHIERVALPGNF